MKIKIFFTSLVALLLFLGCGGGDDSSSNKTVSYKITQNDDYISDANVTDSNNQKATYEGRGIYSFKNEPKGTITLRGGVFEDSNVENKMDMQIDANSNLLSPMASFFYMHPDLKDDILKALKTDDIDYIKTKNVALFRTSKLVYVMASNGLEDEFANSLKNVKSYNDIAKKARDVSAISPRANTINAYLAAIALSFFDIDNTSYISKIVDDVDFVISSTYPKDGDIDVPINAIFQITFNQAIKNAEDSITLKETTSQNSVNIQTQTNGNIVNIKPVANLNENTKYTLSIKSQIQNQNGQTLDKDKEINFTTSNQSDTTKPTIIATFPNQPGHEMAYVTDRATVEFSESIDITSVKSGGIQIYDKNDTKDISNLRFTFSNSDKNVTVDNFLTVEHEYTFKILTSIVDKAGNLLANSSSIDFKVVDDSSTLEIASIEPHDVSGVSVDTNVTIKFSRPISNKWNFEQNIAIYREIDNKNYGFSTTMSEDNTKFVLSRSNPYSDNSKFTIEINGTKIKDKTNITLNNDTTYNFTTGVLDNVTPQVISASGKTGTTITKVELNDSDYKSIDGSGGSIQVEFSEVLEKDSIQDKDLIRVKNSNGAYIGLCNSDITTNCSKNGYLMYEDNKTYEIILNNLSAGNYTLEVQNGAKDLAGNAMNSGPNTFLFKID